MLHCSFDSILHVRFNVFPEYEDDDDDDDDDEDNNDDGDDDDNNDDDDGDDDDNSDSGIHIPLYMLISFIHMHPTFKHNSSVKRVLQLSQL
jgi:hypothetical protein